MPKLKLSLIEKLTLVLIALILIVAFGLFVFNPFLLDVYLEEDGIVEWLTVAGLLAGFGICIYRFIKLVKVKNWWFLTVTLILGILLFIAAGEEISWGQRILGIKSSGYFLKNNAQGETNIHNLVINGVKINKLVFSTILITVLGIYLVVLPLLYKAKTGVKQFIDNSGVPVPKTYQIFSFLVVFSISSLLKHERNPELLESAAAILFFLIIFSPFNKYIFQKRGIF
jgi:hypothetical protein